MSENKNIRLETLNEYKESCGQSSNLVAFFHKTALPSLPFLMVLDQLCMQIPNLDAVSEFCIIFVTSKRGL